MGKLGDGKRKGEEGRKIIHLFGYISYGGEHPQHVEKALRVVPSLQWSACVAFRQLRNDLGGDKGCAEERHCVVGYGDLERHVVPAGGGCTIQSNPFFQEEEEEEEKVSVRSGMDRRLENCCCCCVVARVFSGVEGQGRCGGELADA